MQSYFYVIIIDDKREVCQRIEAKIAGGASPGQTDPIVPVKAKSIHISLSELGKSENPIESKWTFGDSVPSALSEASSETPDLIIIDYVYVNPAVATALKDKAIQGAFSEQLMVDRALTPVDLRRWVENTDKLSFGARRSIINTIFNASCPVYLHTYTPQGITPVVGNVNDRIRKLCQVFPNATINSIDTRSEFFNDEEFDWPNPNPRRDDLYYPYQLGVYFDQVVQKEVIRRELNGNRFLRVKRTSLSVSVVTAIGAAIGFAASWVGSVFAELVRQHQYTEAFIMGTGLLLVLLLVGLGSPLLFERWMQKIMPGEELTKR